MLERAIRNLYPNAIWTIRNGRIVETDTEMDNQSLFNEVERLEKEWNATEYQRQRAPEYPSIGDQLDALFHAGVFPPEMAAKIQAVKDKYPKG
jgi:hypothetical protein